MSLDFLEKTEEFKNLIQDIRLGKKGLKAAGLIEAVRPYFLACLGRAIKKRIVYIQPAAQSLSRLEAQCGFYFSQFSMPLGLDILLPLKKNPCEEIFLSLDAVCSRNGKGSPRRDHRLLRTT